MTELLEVVVPKWLTAWGVLAAAVKNGSEWRMNQTRFLHGCNCHACSAVRAYAMACARDGRNPKVSDRLVDVAFQVALSFTDPVLKREPVLPATPPGEGKVWNCPIPHLGTVGLRTTELDPEQMGTFNQEIEKAEQQLQICAGCGETLDALTTYLIPDAAPRMKYCGNIYCRSCQKDRMLIRECGICNEAIRIRDQALFVNDHPVCPDCSNRIPQCDQCGYLYIPGEDKTCGCGGRAIIHPYNYKPTFKYYHAPSESRDPRTLMVGLEFEVLCPSRATRDRMVKHIYDRRWLYCVHDGSIGMVNFEAVTMPMTLKFYQEEAREFIGLLLDQWRASGCHSWESGTCGLHIHLNRASIYSTHLFKILKLWLQNPQFAIDVAQRQRDDWFDDYSSLDHYQNYTRDLVGRSKGMNPVRPNVRPRGGYPAGRYSAINTTSTRTVEFRLFKGSLRLPVVEKNLEAVLATYDYTKRASLTGTNVPAFCSFVEHNHSRYPNLYRFLRGIGYIGGERIASIIEEYKGD